MTVSANELRRKWNKAVRRGTQATLIPGKMGKPTGASTWTFDVLGYPEWVYVQVTSGSSNTVEKAKLAADVPFKGDCEIWLDLDPEGHYVVVAQRNIYKRGNWLRVYTANVSNPPTDAELDAAIGTPASRGQGYKCLLNDNGASTNVYEVCTPDGTNWFYAALTKAT